MSKFSPAHPNARVIAGLSCLICHSVTTVITRSAIPQEPPGTIFCAVCGEKHMAAATWGYGPAWQGPTDPAEWTGMAAELLSEGLNPVPGSGQPRPNAQVHRQSFEHSIRHARAEARRARLKYPEYPDNTQHDWLRAAMEELGECAHTIHNGGMTQDEMTHLKEEVIQLAAIALNWATYGDFTPTKPGTRP